MALDPSAGQKRSVSITRNLLPQAPVEMTPIATPPASAVAATTSTPSTLARHESAPAYERVANKPVAAQSGRNKKISFLTDSALELRFRKARLKGGFEKLEDAYNEALKVFCEKIERS